MGLHHSSGIITVAQTGNNHALTDDNGTEYMNLWLEKFNNSTEKNTSHHTVN